MGIDRCARVHPNGERCVKPAGHEGNHGLDPVKHRCHARGCTTAVEPRMLMCLKHWRMVPRKLQRVVLREYREGQERTKDPTMAYLNAADAAINAVAKREGATC